MAKNQRRADLDEYLSKEARAKREFERQVKEELWAGYFQPPMTSPDYPFAISWCVEGFLPKSSLTLLAGPPKEGKTAFATALAIAVAKGDDFLGCKVEQGPVLWAAQEENLQEREEILSRCPEYNSGTLDFHMGFSIPPIDTEEAIEMLAFVIRRLGAKLLVVDPLYGAVSGVSLQEGHFARRAMQNLKHLATRTRCAIIVLHQLSSGRSQRIADSVQLQAAASINMTLTRAPLPCGSSGERGWGEGHRSEINSCGSSGERGWGEGHRSACGSSGERGWGEGHRSEITSCGSSGERGWGEGEESTDAVRPTAGEVSLVTLRCRGRGAFANRIWHLKSSGPLHFEVESGYREQISLPPRRTKRETIVVQAIESGLKDTGEIQRHTGIKLGTLRNLLTKLGNENQIHVKWKDGRSKEFHPLSASPQTSKPDEPEPLPSLAEEEMLMAQNRRLDATQAIMNAITSGCMTKEEILSETGLSGDDLDENRARGLIDWKMLRGIQTWYLTGKPPSLCFDQE